MQGAAGFLYAFNRKFTKESCSEKLFFKSVKIWQNYAEKSEAPFLAHPVYVLVRHLSFLHDILRLLVVVAVFTAIGVVYRSGVRPSVPLA